MHTPKPINEYSTHQTPSYYSEKHHNQQHTYKIVQDVSKAIFVIFCIVILLLPMHLGTSIFILTKTLTYGELMDQAVDNTLNNKDFMKYAEEQKR